MSGWLPLTACLLLVLAACGGGGTAPEPGPTPEPHPLDHLEQALLGIHGRPYLVWLARTPAEQSQGLKGITPEQIAPLPDGTERGMLFVFAADTRPSFWMRDTIIPLDLAYVRSDGVVTETHALVPLDETPVPAGSPIRYGLELRGGVFVARGIGPDDEVDLAAVGP